VSPCFTRSTGNVGAVLRIGACLGVPIDIIEPCGFAFSDRSLKRAAMDYRQGADFVRHADWASFEQQCPGASCFSPPAADIAAAREFRMRRRFAVWGGELGSAGSRA
jgi:tRNA(Leu) C34 or U34 (ribose-2'-O)-methylase TrmL